MNSLRKWNKSFGNNKIFQFWKIPRLGELIGNSGELIGGNDSQKRKDPGKAHRIFSITAYLVWQNIYIYYTRNLPKATEGVGWKEKYSGVGPSIFFWAYTSESRKEDKYERNKLQYLILILTNQCILWDITVTIFRKIKRSNLVVITGLISVNRLQIIWRTI